MKRIEGRVVTAMSLAFLATGSLWAQDFPTKTVRVVTGAAGGGSDFTARQIAQAMAANLAQPVVVDNRATTILVADGGAKSPPDEIGRAHV